jgi:hypothetical protein
MTLAEHLKQAGVVGAGGGDSNAVVVSRPYLDVYREVV